jgi:hypothetical protein
MASPKKNARYVDHMAMLDIKATLFHKKPARIMRAGIFLLILLTFIL